jgi:chemotaxis signal transduction protein
LTTLSSISTKAAEFRRVFDQARAAPSSTGAEVQAENLLAIRVARDVYAIRVSEISGISTDRRIIAFPSPIPELLGVAGLRGVLVPVYSLAALLGYGLEAEEVRWCALCGTEEPFALAFSGFEGYLRVPHTELYPAEQREVTRTFVTHVARTTDMVRAVVSIPLFREAIQERCPINRAPKE